MDPITVAIPFHARPSFAKMLQPFVDSPLVERILVIHAGKYAKSHPKCVGVQAGPMTAGDTLKAVFQATTTEHLLSIDRANRHDMYKDTIRTIEILARQGLNWKGC